MGPRLGVPRVGSARLIASCLAVGLVVTACTAADGPPTDPSPSAVPGATASEDPRDRIAIIVGPASHVSPAEAAALESAARVLADEPPDDVAEVRVVRASSAPFTGDLVELFTDQGYDLVCVVGTGAAPLLLDAARVHRGTRMCGTDAAVEGGPANVVSVAPDPVALTTIAAAGVQQAAPPVGLVVGPEVGGLEVVEPVLSSLLPVGTPPPPPPSPAPTDAPVGPPPPSPGPTVVAASTLDASLTGAVAEVRRADPELAVLLAPLTDDAVATFAGGGTRSVVVEDWVATPGEPLPGSILLAVTVDRDSHLRAAVTAGRDPASPQVQLLPLGGGVFGATQGSGPGAAAAFDRAQAVVEDARTE